MAQIPDLVEATVLNDADEVLLRQGGVDKRLAGSALVDSLQVKLIDRLNPATIAIAIDDATVQVDDVLNVVEHTSGNDGGATWAAITKGTTVDVDLPNGDDIVESTGNTSIALKLRVRDKVDPLTIGAVGDGATNDAAKVNRAIALSDLHDLPLFLQRRYELATTVKFLENMLIYGIGEQSGFNVNTTGIATISVVGNNVTMRDFKLFGKASGGIQIRANADATIIDNTLLDNIMFEGTDNTNFITQCVWLYGSTNTRVVNCNFNRTGYGVISQFGFVANDVLVDSCAFSSMNTDAVEANSGGAVVSERWTITNNKYLGASDYPFDGPERRFVGTASIKGCIISNNTIINAGGDAAIHIESNGGETVISGNTFKDCFGAQGNDGWIYLLNSTKDVTIIGNMFIYENDVGFQSAISVSSSSIVHKMSITGNTIIDISGLHQFTAFAVKSVTSDSNICITGNSGSGLNKVADMVGTKKIIFSANNFGDCNDGFDHTPGTSGTASQDLIISNNYIEASGDALDIGRNTSGTQPPRNIIVSGNRFDGNVIFKFTEDCIFTSNLLGSGFTIDKAAGVRLIFENNAQIGIGPIT